MKKSIQRHDLIYPELSYRIVGVLFSVFNELGYGYKEQYYQRAIAKELKEFGIPFQEQIVYPIKFKGSIIGKHIFDFLIDNKIILEIKRGDRFSSRDIVQTTGYLRTSNLKLAILARFSSRGLKAKRILNLDSYIRKNS